MMTALTILGGLSMFSTLFILTALVAARRTTPQPGSGMNFGSRAENGPVLTNSGALVSGVRLAA